MALYSIGYIARYYGVSPSTIRRCEASGKIPASIRTIGGHRRFEQTEDEQPAERKHVGYARVSSHDQRADLDRQIERLQSYGCEEICSDVGSGLNCAKPGLKRLLRDLLDHKIHTLTVTHEDRLLRFGVGLVKFICEKVGTTFRVMETKPPESFEAELAKDVITLMTVFCARLYARRARRKRHSSDSTANK